MKGLQCYVDVDDSGMVGGQIDLGLKGRSPHQGDRVAITQEHRKYEEKATYSDRGDVESKC